LFVIQELNFLLFHGLAEVFSIIIAGGVFLVAWNSRKVMDSDFLLIIGVAYAFVAFLDLLHTFSYAGMGVFPEHGANLPTQLWVAARYLEAVSLVVGTAFIGSNWVSDQFSFSRRPRDTLLLVVVYGAVTTILLVTIVMGWFPAAYVEGTGLTLFKIISEYTIIGLLGLALGLMYRHRVAFDSQVFRYLAIAFVLTMGAEFAFTTYGSVYSTSNAIGHLLKIASFYLIYLAIIKTGISAPQELLFRQLSAERDSLADREAELKRQNERLEDFASIVSHDLRNPLNVAQGRTELLTEEYDSEHIEALERSLNRMDDLIEDLLTLARDGERVSEVETVDLDAVAQECWQQVATADAAIEMEINRTILADRSRLQQLLENLIRNAIEHGGSDVTVTIGNIDDGFYIEDDGPGIPGDKRDEVFEAGYSTAEGGTGFGLNIVEQIAEAHGWEVRVTEGSEGGARFEITGIEFDAE
jgi:signal transduction histidine kinase